MDMERRILKRLSSGALALPLILVSAQAAAQLNNGDLL